MTGGFKVPNDTVVLAPNVRTAHYAGYRNNIITPANAETASRGRRIRRVIAIDTLRSDVDAWLYSWAGVPSWVGFGGPPEVIQVWLDLE